MSATNNGGPAFPQAHHSISVSDAQGARELLGMSLRDWFAGMALQGELSNPSFDAITPQEYASDAYNMADAMLAAREGKEAK